ncbi:MAG TPA: hypothetical protein VJZ26_18715 [Blastocatellia bacterium]|nr:hypothetical protein [Blastocatellia bacterium]
MGHNYNRPPGDDVKAAGDLAPQRKSYERPQVIYRAPLEAMAVVCAPSPPAKSNPGVCPSGPISS